MSWSWSILLQFPSIITHHSAVQDIIDITYIIDIIDIKDIEARFWLYYLHDQGGWRVGEGGLSFVRSQYY